MKKLFAALLFLISVNVFGQNLPITPSFRSYNPQPNPTDSIFMTWGFKPGGYSTLYSGSLINQRYLRKADTASLSNRINSKLSKVSLDSLQKTYSNKVGNIDYWLKRHPGYGSSKAFDTLVAQGYKEIIFPARDSVYNLDWNGFVWITSPRDIRIVVEPGATLRLKDNASRSPKIPTFSSFKTGAVTVLMVAVKGGNLYNNTPYSISIENYGYIDCNQTNNRGFNTGGGQPGRDVHGIGVDSAANFNIRSGLIADAWWTTTVGASVKGTVHDGHAIRETVNSGLDVVTGSGVRLGNGCEDISVTNYWTDGYSEGVDINPVARRIKLSNIYGDRVYEALYEHSGAAGVTINGLYGFNCKRVLDVSPYQTQTGAYGTMFAAVGTASPGLQVFGAHAFYTDSLGFSKGAGDVVPFRLRDAVLLDGAFVWHMANGTSYSVYQPLFTSKYSTVKNFEIYQNTSIKFTSPYIINFNGGELGINRAVVNADTSQVFLQIEAPGSITAKRITGVTSAANSKFAQYKIFNSLNIQHTIQADSVAGFANTAYGYDAPGVSQGMRIITPGNKYSFRPYTIMNSVWLPRESNQVLTNTGGLRIQWLNIGGITADNAARVNFSQNTLANTPTALAGGGLTFDGTDDYVSMVAPTAVKTTNFTVGFRFKINSLPASEARFINFGGLANWRMRLSTSGQIGISYTNVSSSTIGLLGATLSTGTWYTVILTSANSGADINIYINSTTPSALQTGGTAMRNTSWGANMNIGSSAGSNPLAMDMSDFVFLPTGTPTSQNITDLYNMLANGMSLENNNVIINQSTTALSEAQFNATYPNTNPGQVVKVIAVGETAVRKSSTAWDITYSAPSIGTANQLIRVNSGATALEYFTPSYGSGTVTSITPGYGFTSSTPITTTGTMTVDTASSVLSKSNANANFLKYGGATKGLRMNNNSISEVSQLTLNAGNYWQPDIISHGRYAVDVSGSTDIDNRYYASNGVAYGIRWSGSNGAHSFNFGKNATFDWLKADSLGIETLEGKFKGDGQAHDGMGVVHVTRSAAGGNKAYYGLTRKDATAMALGMNTTNSFIMGTGPLRNSSATIDTVTFEHNTHSGLTRVNNYLGTTLWQVDASGYMKSILPAYSSGTYLPTVYNSTNDRFETISSTALGVPLSGSYSFSVTAETTFTVTIGSTMANNTYKVNVTPTSALGAQQFYVTNKTTTTFDVVYGGLPLAPGTLTFDWAVFP